MTPIRLTATLVRLNPETRRVTLERDGRCFEVPLTRDECANVGAYTGMQLAVTMTLPDPVGEAR
jgi:hypothetical protein